MSFLHILFSPVGRIRRRDYWLYSIGLWIGALLVRYLVHHFVFRSPDKTIFSDANWMQGNTGPYALFSATLFVGAQWPAFCVAAKRWHDRNRPAWIGALCVAALSLNYAVTLAFGKQGLSPNLLASNLLGLPALGLFIWQFVECGCLDGTPGPNRYGPSPKGLNANPAAVF